MSQQLPQLCLLLLILTVPFTAAQYLHEMNPLTTEQFEAVFNDVEEMRNTFRTIPSYAYLFARPPITEPDRNWIPMQPWCLVQLMDEGKGNIHRTCTEALNEFFKLDPTLSNILLAYRCYRSGGGADYELHTASLEKIGDNVLPGLHDAYTIYFTPQKAERCRVRYAKDVPIGRIYRELKMLDLEGSTGGGGGHGNTQLHGDGPYLHEEL